MSIQRRVRLLESSKDIPNNNTSLPFSHYLDVSNIILLGDPGSGKTHTFEAASKEEKTKLISVRNFCYSAGERCEGQTIYLDGLDEFRSRMDGKSIISEVMKLLHHIQPAKLRLSCRATPLCQYR